MKQEDNKKDTKVNHSETDDSNVTMVSLEPNESEHSQLQSPIDDFEDRNDDSHLEGNINPYLSPRLPRGEAVLPNIPLNITFFFITVRTFSKIHLYFDPIYSLSNEEVSRIRLLPT